MRKLERDQIQMTPRICRTVSKVPKLLFIAKVWGVVSLLLPLKRRVQLPIESLCSTDAAYIPEKLKYLRKFLPLFTFHRIPRSWMLICNIQKSNNLHVKMNA